MGTCAVVKHTNTKLNDSGLKAEERINNERLICTISEICATRSLICRQLRFSSITHTHTHEYTRCP